jgi:CheY-like chemotaxis protein
MQQATLLLPEKAAAPGSMAGPDEDDDTGAGIKAPVRVLIVEDEVLTALDIEYLVEGMGYDVCGMVASAPEAIKAAQDQRPDLVLMDIRLAHGTDGIQEAGAIRDRFGIPSLYLSAHTDTVTRHRAQATSPLGFVFKPYTRAQLESSLRDAVATLRGGID